MSRVRQVLFSLAVVMFWVATQVSAQIPKGDLVIELEIVASGLVAPVDLTHAGDGSGRLFIVDQSGPIRIVKGGALLSTPFLDLTAEIPALSPGFDERGVLGLAFHPDYADNGRFFVRYGKPRAGDPSEPCFGTSRDCHEEVLAEFSVSADPDVADPTGTILFRIDEPQFNHDAGTVAFGPDGFLYFSLGDGGGAHDGLADVPPSHGPIGHGQNIETALGAILRIDVDGGSPYAIPPDNPFVGAAGVDEIYAYGLRNPYKFSFDDGPGGDGRLFLADVGQNLFEEVNIITKGGNYGWVIREGFQCFDPFNPRDPPASCSSTGPSGEPLLDPIVDYSHEDGGISVIGGFVYRGSSQPSLQGTYIFGDFSDRFSVPGGRLYFLVEPAPGSFEIRQFQIGAADIPYGRFLKGFGEDEAGEIYVLGSTALAPIGNTGVVERLRLAEQCDPDPDPRGQGYWNRQCLGAGLIAAGRSGRGPQEPLEADFVKVLEPAVSAILEAKTANFFACEDGMDADPPSDPCERALKQYTALLFNLQSDRLQSSCGVDLQEEGCSSTSVGALVDELAGLINSGDAGECRTAADCAAALNDGGGIVEAGLLQATAIAATPAGTTALDVAGNVASRWAEMALLEQESVVVSEPALAGAMPTLVGIAGTPEKARPDRRPTAEESTAGDFRSHIAILANPSLSSGELEESVDALLTALSGGYGPNVRMEMVVALVPTIDESLHSLLAAHLRNIRDEALDFENDGLVWEAERLLKQFDPSE